MNIRNMSLKHLDEVLAIERDSFLTPWSEPSFRQEIEGKESSLAVVVSENERVIGYGIAWIIVDEIHIGNIAVRRDYRRRRIGAMLLDHLLETGKSRGCCLATLEVRRSNLPAIGLYQTFGFSSIAVRKDYYRDTHEDAIVMLKHFEQDRQAPVEFDLVHREDMEDTAMARPQEQKKGSPFLLH
jgi:ribosomal-protein-alanine N-acetyltransferase